MGFLLTCFEWIAIYAVFLFLIILGVAKRKTTGAKAFGIASDVCTVFFFFSIPLLTERFFNESLGVMHFIVFVALLMIMTTMEWQLKDTLDFGAAFKKTWRLLFILCFLCYIGLWIAHWLLQ